MRLVRKLLLGIFILSSCNNVDRSSKVNSKNVQNNPAIQWVFDKVSGKVLKFKDGKEFKTDLFELKYIGQIENGSKAPFLIFSGRYCDECDENISIYVHSPSEGKLNVDMGKNRYEYPGTVRDYENDSLLSKSRAFYGNVLPGIKGVIWYMDDLMEDKSWKKSTFLVNLNDTKKESIFKDQEKLPLTLKLLNEGSCKEMIGLNLKSEP